MWEWAECCGTAGELVSGDHSLLHSVTVLLPRDSVTWHVTNNQLCCQQRAVRSWWKPLSVFLFVDIPCDADVAWWRSQSQKVQNRGLNIYFGNCIFRKFSTNMIYDYEYHFVYLILYAIMHKYLELNWDWIIFRVLVTSGLLDMMIDLVISASRSSVSVPSCWQENVSVRVLTGPGPGIQAPHT